MHPILALHTMIRLHSPVTLCLHSVGAGVDALPSAIFRSLLEALLERRFEFLTADDVVHSRVLRRRTVLLTFDDGRQDNFDVVLPILNEYGIGATFYVCPSLVGRETTFVSHLDVTERNEQHAEPFTVDMMNWAALRELRDRGMCLGSHTASHLDLTRCNQEQLDAEIVGSKAVLEEQLERPVRHFSYPWGRFDERVLRVVRAAGYETAAAVSVNPLLPIHPWNAYTLPRVTVHPSASLPELLRLIAFPNMVRRTLSQTRRSLIAFRGRVAA